MIALYLFLVIAEVFRFSHQRGAAKKQILSATSSFTFGSRHSFEVIPQATAVPSALDVASLIPPLNAENFPSNEGDSTPRPDNDNAHSSNDTSLDEEPNVDSTTFATPVFSNSPTSDFYSMDYLPPSIEESAGENAPVDDLMSLGSPSRHAGMHNRYFFKKNERQVLTARQNSDLSPPPTTEPIVKNLMKNEVSYLTPAMRTSTLWPILSHNHLPTDSAWTELHPWAASHFLAPPI